MKTVQITFNGTYYFIEGDDLIIRCDQVTMLELVKKFLPVYNIENIEEENEN